MSPLPGGKILRLTPGSAFSHCPILPMDCSSSQFLLTSIPSAQLRPCFSLLRFSLRFSLRSVKVRPKRPSHFLLTSIPSAQLLLRFRPVQRNQFAPLAAESGQLAVPDFPEDSRRLIQIAGQIFRLMGVGADRQRHAPLPAIGEHAAAR